MEAPDLVVDAPGGAGPVDQTVLASVHDQVRGLHPWPHAYTFLSGARVIVLRTRIEPAEAASQRPGTVVRVSREAIHVAAGGGVIAIEQLQPEGKRPMNAREYLAGRPLSAGVVLGA